MDCALRIAPSSARSTPKISPFKCNLNKNSRFLHRIGYGSIYNDAVLLTSSSLRSTARVSDSDFQCMFSFVG